MVVTSAFLEVLPAAAFLAFGNMIGAIVALLFGLVIASLGIFAVEVRALEPVLQRPSRDSKES